MDLLLSTLSDVGALVMLADPLSEPVDAKHATKQ